MYKHMDTLMTVLFVSKNEIWLTICRCKIKCFLGEKENSLERYPCQRPSLFVEMVTLCIADWTMSISLFTFYVKWSRSLNYGSLWWRWLYLGNTFKLYLKCYIFLIYFILKIALAFCGSKWHFIYLPRVDLKQRGRTLNG